MLGAIIRNKLVSHGNLLTMLVYELNEVSRFSHYSAVHTHEITNYKRYKKNVILQKSGGAGAPLPPGCYGPDNHRISFTHLFGDAETNFVHSVPIPPFV